MDSLGARIEAMRKARLLTQVELAGAAGVAVITINRLENGVGNDSPHPSTVRKIAAALGVDPAWLLFGDSLTTEGHDGD